MNIIELINKYKLFIGYIICAGIATIFDFGLLYILTEFIKIHYISSATISYMLGMATNFILNKYFNFKNKSKKILKQSLLFLLIALIGLGLNNLILWYLVEFIELWYMTAKAISICIVMLWSFYGHKKITFEVIK
jgi:putative flippase GtrA